MSQRQSHNPFTRTGALKLDDPLFRGRVAELARLERACLSDHKSFLLVYGGRQTGKTSLLLRLEHTLRQHIAVGVRVCRVDFQQVPRASAPDAYRYLAHQVADVLPGATEQPPTLDAPGLTQFLETALRQSDLTRLVLLLDELGTLPDATREDLAHVLRSLHTRRLVSPELQKTQFALAGGIELYNLAVIETSALNNVCEVVRLGDLSKAEAIALIADGLATLEIDHSAGETLGQAIYTRVRGHPYLTQRLGEALAAQHLRGDTPDTDAVEERCWTLLEEDDALLEHLRRSIAELRLEDAARWLLTGTQRTTRTDDATARLELLGMARRERGRWLPRNPLLTVALAEWLRFALPAEQELPDAAAAVRGIALEQRLHDLQMQQAFIAQRTGTVGTLDEQVQLQRRARDLASDITELEAAMQAISPKPAPQPEPEPAPQPTPPQPQPAVTQPPTPRPQPRKPALPAWVPELVEIPAGPFLIGSSDTDKQASANEKPQHRLELPTYWIGKTPVTNAQFRPFVEGDGYSNADYWTEAGWQWRQKEKIVTPYYWKDTKWNGDDFPVVGVNWFEVVAYCRWLAAQTGIPFRLPTEAEWEKAARGPEGLIYPWGNQAPTKELANFNQNVGRTTPVGSYPDGASPYGALDMAGNVWEWCVTKRQKKYPYQLEQEWTEEYLAGDHGRLLRGGSYANEQKFVRGAYRSLSLDPRNRFSNDGVRLASHSPS